MCHGQVTRDQWLPMVNGHPTLISGMPYSRGYVYTPYFRYLVCLGLDSRPMCIYIYMYTYVVYIRIYTIYIYTYYIDIKPDENGLMIIPLYGHI